MRADVTSWPRRQMELKPIDKADALERLRKGYKLSGICSTYGISEGRIPELLAIAEEAGLQYQERAHGPKRDRTPKAQPTRARVTLRPLAGRGVTAIAPPSQDRTPACRSEDPDLFFSEEIDNINAAKAVCAGCPVRASCLAYALDHGEQWGTWGAESAEERAVTRRKRRQETAA